MPPIRLCHLNWLHCVTGFHYCHLQNYLLVRTSCFLASFQNSNPPSSFSFSSRTKLSDGCRRTSSLAVARPTIPPPTTATSYVLKHRRQFTFNMVTDERTAARAAGRKQVSGSTSNGALIVWAARRPLKLIKCCVDWNIQLCHNTTSIKDYYLVG